MRANPNRPFRVLTVSYVTGGLVEITAKRDDTSPVLTRTIGDPSTGTGPLPSGPKEEASPSRSNRSLPSVGSQSAEPTARPNFLELPAPQDFSQTGFAGPSNLSPASGSTLVGAPAPGSGAPPSSTSFMAALVCEPGLKVLVVDDDPLTRKLMSRMLTRVGCKVSTAENGEIALEMTLGMGNRQTPSSEETGSAGLSAEGSIVGRASMGLDEYKYSVIFLDNQMPVMSGLEMVAKLRELGRRDFVVGVTGRFGG